MNVNSISQPATRRNWYPRGAFFKLPSGSNTIEGVRFGRHQPLSWMIAALRRRRPAICVSAEPAPNVRFRMTGHLAQLVASTEDRAADSGPLEAGEDSTVPGPN